MVLRIFRSIAILIALLLVLTVGSVIALIVWFNPNNLKPQITSWVYQKTGRQILLTGDIKWTIYPWLGSQINQAQMDSGATFNHSSFARIEQANIRVQLLPLFQRQIQIDEIKLSGLKLNLVKNASGLGNWQNLYNDNSSTVVNSQKNTSTKNSSANNQLIFAVARVNVSNGEIKYQDLQQNKNYQVSQLQVHSSNLSLNKPFNSDMQFILQSNQPVIKGDFHIKETLTYSPGNVRAQGMIKIGNLLLNQFKIANISAQTEMKNNIIRLNSITAQAYQGILTGSALINLNKTIPAIKIDSDLSNLKIEQLLQAIGTSSSIQPIGISHLQFHLTTSGNDSNSLLAHLNGNGSFAVNNGLLKGIDIPYWLSMGKNLLNQQLGSAQTNTAQTDLGNLTGTFNIANGIAENNDLTLKGKQVSLTGKGQVNLVNQTLNYNLSAQSLRADNSTPEGMIIPLQISGTFNNIKIRPVMDALIKAEAMRQIEKHKDKIQTVITNTISGAIGKNLDKNTDNLIKNQLNQLLGN